VLAYSNLHWHNVGTCMYVCMYVCMYICMYIFLSIYVYMYTCIYVYIRGYAHIHNLNCVRICSNLHDVGMHTTKNPKSIKDQMNCIKFSHDDFEFLVARDFNT